MIILALATLSSCYPMYQVLETSSPDTKMEKDNYVFENSEIKINYNFWTNGGQISFILTNKTDEPLYLDWNKSHFIYNGISYEYWYDAEETKSFYSSSTSSTSETFADTRVNVIDVTAYGSGRSSTSAFNKKMSLVASNKYKPKQIIHIPPKSSILVSKFSISKSPFYTCDFPFKMSLSKTPTTKTFTKENSPLTFRNYLTYSAKENFEQTKIVNNEFYISSVSNMYLYVFQGKPRKEKYCKQSGYVMTKQVYPYPYKKPNAFFIKSQ
jgi:hypothetical protein